MKTRKVSLPHPILRAIAFGLANLLAFTGLQQALAQAPLRISSAGLVGGKVMLNWTGNTNAESYEVQSTTNLTVPSWTPVLSTVRTNAQVQLNGTSQFYRVIDPQFKVASMSMNTTNLGTSETLVFSLLSKTNSDLIFHVPDDGSGSYAYLISTRAIQERYDVLLYGGGRFAFAINGDPLPLGGVLASTNGPGANDITTTGFLTNGPQVLAFSGVFHQATNANRVSAQGLTDFGDPQYSPSPGWFGLGATGNYYACKQDSAWSLKNLQCKNACATPCSFFPPMGRTCGVIFKMGNWDAQAQQYECEVLQCVQCCGANCSTNFPTSY